MDRAAETSPLHVTRAQIVSRGFANRCPNCGEHTLFPPRSLRIHETCPACGVAFDPGSGFWLGPLVINYTLSVVFFVVPFMVLGVRGVLPIGLAVGLAVVGGGFAVPLLLYRSSWSWWLMVYYYFLPDRLPANGGPMGVPSDD